MIGVNFLRFIKKKWGRTFNFVIVYASKDGFSPRTSGTYIHPKMIFHLAMWIDKEFAVKVQQIMDSVDKLVHQQVEAQGLVDVPKNTGAAFDKFIESWELANQITYDICSEVETVLQPSEARAMWYQFKKVNDLFEKSTGKETGLVKNEEKKKDEEEEDDNSPNIYYMH
jgi:hypothetical protein